MKNKNKKGTHVGIIASFSIFILFIIAILFIFEPFFSSEKNKDLIVSLIEEKLMEQIQGDLIIVALNSSQEDCMIVDSNKFSNNSPTDFVARGKNSGVLATNISGSDFYIDLTTNNVTYLYVSYDEVFDEVNLESCAATYSPEIAWIRKDKVIFKKKIINLTDNFEGFKNFVGLNQNEFAIIFEMNNGTIIRVGEKNTEKDIYVKNLDIDYYDENASKVSGIIKIKTW